MRRPCNYWSDFANVERELLAFIAEHGTPGIMPTAQALKEARHSTLVEANMRHGGHYAVAQRLNLNGKRVYHSPVYWQDFANIERELCVFLTERGTPTVMPTEREFHAAGRDDLLHGIWLNGGIRAVAERLGLSLADRSKPDAYWQQHLDAEVRAFIRDHGEEGCLPTEREFVRAGRSDLGRAIDGQGGYVAVAQRLGLRNAMPSAPRRRWKNIDMLFRELADFMAEHNLTDRMPTASELNASGRADLAAAIQQFGGWRVVAAQLGLALRGRGQR